MLFCTAVHAVAGLIIVLPFSSSERASNLDVPTKPASVCGFAPYVAHSSIVASCTGTHNKYISRISFATALGQDMPCTVQRRYAKSPWLGGGWAHLGRDIVP